MYDRLEKRVVEGGDNREGDWLKYGSRHTVVSHVLQSAEFCLSRTEQKHQQKFVFQRSSYLSC